ncbi:MAG: HAMP domain-containing histidine kinase [Gammaproteobacteria bacterium]|nr:HAMP domain-containing histidine kinase [Gammaproteobacteria bacterium]
MMLREWADEPRLVPALPSEVTRFNEAIDEAICESVEYYSMEVERWRDIFLGVLGHDLRTPLTAILMTSEHIGRLASDAPVARAAQRLVDSGESMRRLLDRLLVYSRSRIGVGFEVQRKDVDLAAACREEIDLLRASRPDAGVVLDAPDELRGMFDKASIREALANLVVNAWKYGADGSEVRVELRDRGGAAELVVRNAGEPIPREALQHMFEPLRRASLYSGQPERTSLGLGLFVVSQIAKAHAGTVAADSADGETWFRLELPRS